MIIILADKREWLTKNNYPQDIIDYSLSFGDKYAIWIAREIKKFRNSLANWFKTYSWYKQQGQEIPSDFLTKIEPTTGLLFSGLADDLIRGEASVSVNAYPVDNSKIRDVIDWIDSEDPDIMRFSLSQAIEASDIWHQKFTVDDQAKYSTNHVVYEIGNGWRIVFLTPEDCETEGDLMGHCVGGYANAVRSGRTKIFSLRDNKNTPHATIEMVPFAKIAKKPINRKLEIIQIQGKSNQDPIAEYVSMISKWFEHLQQIGYELFSSDDSNDEVNATDEKFTDQEFVQKNKYGILSMVKLSGDYKSQIDNIISQEERTSYVTKVEYLKNLADYANAVDKSLSKDKRFTNENSNLDQFVEDYHEYIDEINENFINSYEPENKPPREEDFTTRYHPDPSQPEFQSKDFEGTKQTIFDQQGFDKAQREYDDEIENAWSDSDYYRMFEYVMEYVNEIKYKNRQEKDNEETTFWDGVFFGNPYTLSLAAKSKNWYKETKDLIDIYHMKNCNWYNFYKNASSPSKKKKFYHGFAFSSDWDKKVIPLNVYVWAFSPQQALQLVKKRDASDKGRSEVESYLALEEAGWTVRFIEAPPPVTEKTESIESESKENVDPLENKKQEYWQKEWF